MKKINTNKNKDFVKLPEEWFDNQVKVYDETDTLLYSKYGKIKAAYGCSLGGSFVGLLVQRKNINIEQAILGGSDLDQDEIWKAKLKCKIAISLLHKIVSTGEYPKVLQGLMEKKRTLYRDKFMAMFGIGNGVQYLDRYMLHFVNPVIHEFDLEHEELLVLYPEQWVKKVMNLIEIGENKNGR